MNTYRVITKVGADIDVECDGIEISDNGDLILYKNPSTAEFQTTLAVFADGYWTRVYRKDVAQVVLISTKE